MSFDRYYLDSKRELLDIPGEWHYDTNTKRIRFMPYDGKCPDPESQRVRGRTIDYAMEVTDTIGLTVKNMKFFSAAFIANSTNLLTENIELNTVDFQFPSSSKRMLGKVDVPNWTKIKSEYNWKFGAGVKVVNIWIKNAKHFPLV